jgi:hypothetical protein
MDMNDARATAMRVNASTIEKIVRAPCCSASSTANFPSVRPIPRWARIFPHQEKPSESRVRNQPKDFRLQRGCVLEFVYQNVSVL